MLRIFINIRQDLVNIILLFQIVKVQIVTFNYSAIKDWNSLPEKLKTIQDNKKFKFELKTFLQLHNQSKVEVLYMYFLPMDTVASM